MRPKTWTTKDLLSVTSDYLAKKHIDSPRLTAEILLAHQLNVDRVTLYLNFDQPLTEKEISGYRSLIRRRLSREPWQYITGHQEFWSIDFIVCDQVLIPRPESELLVEQAVERIKASGKFENNPLKILDLGTGCGALAISLAMELPRSQIWATDISSGALKLARFNAERNNVSQRIQFLEGNLWEPLVNIGITFDIILSNPPYVSSQEYSDLPPEVRDYEPRLALDGRQDGMYYIEKIIKGGIDFLNYGGWIMLETAPHQSRKAVKLMEQIEGYVRIDRIKDYSHLYRVVEAQKHLPKY